LFGSAEGWVASTSLGGCGPCRASGRAQHIAQNLLVPSPCPAGYDITTHVLACFGGAGPQHACAIARALGMRRIFISRFSGILSAYGE